MVRVRKAYLLVFVLGLAMGVSAQPATSVVARIVAVEAEFANILLDASPQALRELGLLTGTRFTFTHNGQSYSATLVEEYGDVEKGQWLGRIWEDRVELAISFGNACTVLDCKVGDAVSIIPSGHGA